VGLSTGEWPKGIVRARDGDDSNFRSENLIVLQRGHSPFSTGTASLVRRATADRVMLQALAEHPGRTLPQLSRLTGSFESCVCTRLSKLAERGLTCGPRCNARARWLLTPAGRQLAAAAVPVLDDLDRRILTACSRSPARLITLARLMGVCSLTAHRRVDALVERGLARTQDADQRSYRFMITDEGRKALGGDAPRLWLRVEAISAALAKDVLARSATDDRTRWGAASTAHWRARRPTPPRGCVGPASGTAGLWRARSRSRSHAVLAEIRFRALLRLWDTGQAHGARLSLRDGPRWRWSTAIDPAGEFGRSHVFARLPQPGFLVFLAEGVPLALTKRKRFRAHYAATAARDPNFRLQFLAADQGDPVLEDRLLAAIDADDAAREARSGDGLPGRASAG